MNLDVNTWKSRFCNLTPKNQLKVAKAIIEELDFNITDMEDDEDQKEYAGYDKSESRMVENTLYNFVYNLESNLIKQKELSKYRSILEEFKKLPEEAKQNIAVSLFSELELRMKWYHEKEKERLCEEKGHNYSDWHREERNLGPKYTEHTIYRGITDAKGNIVGNIPEKRIFKEDNIKITWCRTCKRCGHVQRVDTYEEVEELSRKRVLK